MTEHMNISLFMHDKATTVNVRARPIFFVAVSFSS